MFLRILSGSIFFLAAGLNIAAQQKSPAAPARPDFQISGTLVDAITGQPLAHARVAIAPVTQRDNFTSIITGEDGRFQFPNLASGKYALAAQARGYLLQSFNQHDQYSSSIVVGPDLDSSNLLFRLPPESAISGMVTDEAGEPVREAQVMLYFSGLAAGTEATRLRGRTMTDDEGTYHFGHLAPGHYLVAVSAKPWYAQYPSPGFGGIQEVISVRGAGGYAGAIMSSIGANSGNAQSNPQLDVAYPVTFYSGVTEASEATAIVLGRGEKATADVNLQPVPALHVRMNTQSADPTKGTYMVLERRVLDGPPIQVATEMRGGGPGIQEIVGIPAGHYTVKTYTAGRGDPSEWTPSREIDINDNGEIDKDQGNVYVPVTATLQFESGAPARQAWLQLLNKKSREVFAERVNGDGETVFKQGVRPGSYEVSLINSPGVYLKNVSATGAKAAGRTIEVRPGGAVKLAINAARGEGEITGTALRDGKPLAGAMIVLVPADPAHNQVLFRRDQSDSDGTFTLPQVVPGAYTVLAIADGWQLKWMAPEVLKSYLPGGIAVQAQPNGKYTVRVPVQ